MTKENKKILLIVVIIAIGLFVHFSLSFEQAVTFYLFLIFANLEVANFERIAEDD